MVPGVWTVGAMIAWISDWTGKIRVDITLLHFIIAIELLIMSRIAVIAETLA